MTTCPFCRSSVISPELFRRDDVFISIGRLDDKPGVPPRLGSIALHQCRGCGFIFNAAFNREMMNQAYASKGYVLKKAASPVMSSSLRSVRDNLLSHVSPSSVVVEIGSGDGALAQSLAPSVRHVYTVDPSVESTGMAGVDNITHINKLFSRDSLEDRMSEKADLVVLRHLLEHISTPRDILVEIKSMLKSEGIVYIEVPNIQEIIRSSRFYDIFHDHFGYFSSQVLADVLAKEGFSPIREVHLFQEQHIGISFKNTVSEKGRRTTPGNLASTMGDRFTKAIGTLNAVLARYDQVALYGAGAHGNSLLNYISPKNIHSIRACYDKDRSKSGKYLQGFSVKIHLPELKRLKTVQAIVIASSLYEQEIVNELRAIGYKGDLVKTAQNIEIV